jgi:hypothetical protein
MGLRRSVRAELLRLATLEETPVDLAQLVCDGVLKRRGTWYEVPDVQRFPKHVHTQVSAIKWETRRGTRVLLFRFVPADRIARYAKQIADLAEREGLHPEPHRSIEGVSPKCLRIPIRREPAPCVSAHGSSALWRRT